MTPGSLPPIGQHSTSITYDQDLLLFDDGFFSIFQQPPGVNRTYASPRKYQLNLNDVTTTDDRGTATVVWNYEQNQTILDPICSSVYEDAPLNYLIDYAFIGGFTNPPQYGPSREGDIKHSLADISRATQELGYQPKAQFHEGLQKTVAWYLEEKEKKEACL